MNLRIIHILIFLFLVNGLHGQKITASTSAQDVLASQPFDVTYTIENGRNASFTPPDFSPLEVSAGPFTSSNIQIVNGRRSESKSFTYRLRASKPGKYTIPPAAIATNTLKRKSNSLEINVLKATKENSMQGNNLYLEMELNDSTIYVGQQLLIDHDIYFGNIQVKGSALVGDFPRDRFLVNQVLNGSKIRATQMKYKGKMQNKAKLSRLALYPLRSGPMEIPDINFDVDVQNPNAPRRRGFFSFNSYDSKVLSTPEFTIDVLPLPLNQPPHFTGCVGSLKATANIDSRSLVAGEESFVSLTLVGDGLADQVDAPSWEQDGFQIFDPKLVNENKQIREGKIVFTKTFQYLVIPDEPGRKSLNIPVSYFDAEREAYNTINASLSNVLITDSGKNLTDATSKTITDFSQSKTTSWYKKLWIWGLLALVLGGIAFYFASRKKDTKEVVSIEEASRIIAQRKLASAKSLLDEKKTGKYWETLENALRIYLEEKLNIGTSDYSIGHISDTWNGKKYAADKLQVWKEMVDKINLARYAGQDIENMEHLYQEALDWIIDVESNYPSS